MKIIPGQSKRGKASKTAISVFMADKLATNREKDLIKSLKDQDIGRNLPGKVKLAVPQSMKPKKWAGSGSVAPPFFRSWYSYYDRCNNSITMMKYIHKSICRLCCSLWLK